MSAPNDLLPPEEDRGPDRIRTSVRLSPEEHADVELMASVWNEIDKAMGRKRRKKWKASSVMELLVTASVGAFVRKGGGRPKSATERAEFVRRMLGDPKKPAR